MEAFREITFASYALSSPFHVSSGASKPPLSLSLSYLAVGQINFFGNEVSFSFRAFSRTVYECLNERNVSRERDEKCSFNPGTINSNI